ncbi:MAG: DUF4124 domain-containing protein [Gammaproteobacteria bacterium]
MKLHCNRFVLAACLLALACPIAIAGNGSKDNSVYTWVDAQGVRHYSDTPANPNAKLLNLTASANTSATPASRNGHTRSAPKQPPNPQTVAAARKRLTPAERAARCAKLRDEVKRLEPARRVAVKKNGEIRHLAGEDLVAFKKETQQKMQTACAPPH